MRNIQKHDSEMNEMKSSEKVHDTNAIRDQFLANKHRGFDFILERFLKKRIFMSIEAGCLLIVNLATLIKSIVKALRGAF